MIPALEVGGDLYDIVKLDENRVIITIGDVCGKGVPAALFMAITQTIMRLVVRSSQELGAEVASANNLLTANNRETMFTTLFCGVFDVSAGTLTYCNCGHNPPLLLRRGASTFELLRPGGPALGIMDDISYKPPIDRTGARRHAVSLHRRRDGSGKRSICSVRREASRAGHSRGPRSASAPGCGARRRTRERVRGWCTPVRRHHMHRGRSVTTRAVNRGGLI